MGGGGGGGGGGRLNNIGMKASWNAGGASTFAANARNPIALPGGLRNPQTNHRLGSHPKCIRDTGTGRRGSPQPTLRLMRWALAGSEQEQDCLTAWAVR